MLDIPGIFILAYQVHAGGTTTFDLILKTGAVSVGKKTIFTGPDLKQLLDEVECLPDRPGTGIGTKITALALARPTIITQPGIIMLG